MNKIKISVTLDEIADNALFSYFSPLPPKRRATLLRVMALSGLPGINSFNQIETSSNSNGHNLIPVEKKASFPQGGQKLTQTNDSGTQSRENEIGKILSAIPDDFN